MARQRFSLLLVLLLLLAGCSSTTFFYNRLDFVLPWYLERYVNLDRAQSEQTDILLAPLMEWHRREELPRYITFLDDLERELAQPLNLATIEAYTQRAEFAWYRLRDPLLDALLVLGDSLSEVQIDEFIATLEKKQRKYERKYLDRSEEEFREDALENLAESIEDYLGRLEAPQLERLDLAVETLHRSDGVWLAERADWIVAMRQQLKREFGWERRIVAVIRYWESQLDPQTRALYEHNTAVVQAALVDVLNTRSERQDRHLRERIADLREDLVLLTSETDAG
jgi:hypothetical protein